MYETITATASREGTSGPCADAAAVYRTADGTTAAAIVDGIGHAPGTVRLMPVLAEVAARIAARIDGRSGIVTAGQLVASDGTGDEPEPDGPAVVAAVRPDGRVVVHWIGDCRAYAWDDAALVQVTTDHTMGECLRRNSGRSLPEYAAHDNWVLATLSRALPTTIGEAALPDPRLVVLTSDGVHDQVPHSVMEGLVRAHETDPQALAAALVAAAGERPSGRRDDATAVVLVP